MDETALKLFRCILESQVFAHPVALKIWIWCLCKATYKKRYLPLKIGKGYITVELLPGQFVFGRFKAEEELGIDGSTIYKWMQKFSSDEYSMISIESNNQYSIITISKWEEYQVEKLKKVTTKEQPKNNQVTTEEQPSNNSVTQTIKVNNVNNVNNEEELKCTFEIFRKSYPGTKRGLDQEYENLKKKHRNYKEIIPILQNRLIYQKSARQTKRVAGGFVPEWKNLQTWINQGCWEEEIPINGDDKKPVQSIKILNREEYK